MYRVRDSFAVSGGVGAWMRVMSPYVRRVARNRAIREIRGENCRFKKLLVGAEPIRLKVAAVPGHRPLSCGAGLSWADEPSTPSSQVLPSAKDAKGEYRMKACHMPKLQLAKESLTHIVHTCMTCVAQPTCRTHLPQLSLQILARPTEQKKTVHSGSIW
jgi:hypothetical protein